MGASVRVETGFHQRMSKGVRLGDASEITRLRELSARVGSDPLLTQASTGNSSVKLGGVLWIKASGEWMADSMRKDILIPLDLAEVRECVNRDVDPAARHTRASVQTAMHAVMPHRVVLHVHCVNTIAWAVRLDAPTRLERLLDGLRWQWIPYVPSGMPLAEKMEKALALSPNTDVFVLGNHGLVVGGEDCDAAEDLLAEVRRRVAIPPRGAQTADYDALEELADGSAWNLPEDAEVHALGTDAVSREVLLNGFLYPCQAVLSNSNRPGLFRAIRLSERADQWKSRYSTRPFLIVEGCGVLVRGGMTTAEHKVMSGLAQVVRRIHSSAPIRCLSEAEVARSRVTACRYRETSQASHGNSAR